MVIELSLKGDISDSEAAYLVAAALNGTEPNLSGQGCLDYRLQRSVPYGDYYYTLECEICLCSRAERMCKQVSCAPPEHCNGYLKKDPNHCCDICVPVVVEPSGPKDAMGVKLGLMAVALCLLFAVLMFGMYRIGRKRMLINLRNFHILDRTSHGSGDRGYSPRNSCASVSINHNDDSCSVNLNGYSFPEAPPAYQDAVRVASPMLPAGMTTILPSISPCSGGEPPPPYASLNSAVTAHNTINNHIPILTLGVHAPPVNGVCVLPMTTLQGHRRLPSNTRSVGSADRPLPPLPPVCDTCDTADDSVSLSSQSSTSTDSDDDVCSCSQCCDSASGLSLSDTEDDYGGSECTVDSVDPAAAASTSTQNSRPKSKKKKLKKLLFRSKKCSRRKENTNSNGNRVSPQQSSSRRQSPPAVSPNSNSGGSRPWNRTQNSCHQNPSFSPTRHD